MLSVEENERMTRVGPGTPMGELMRRYWHPIATSQELTDAHTKAVTILGEKLVLYKDRSGTLGLLQEKCPHRRVNLAWGIPEKHGLRCPYHGWMFDETGQCLETPVEPPESNFKERIQALAYPVEELGGLIFTYMGPEPRPLLQRWDLFVQEGMVRTITTTDIPANWMQCMENSMDPTHTEWLHAYWTFYQMDEEGTEVPLTPDGRYAVFHHQKIGFDRFEHGIIKRRLMEGQDESHDDWATGHPVLFPNILRTGGFQIRVPVDDTHTWHILYRAIPAENPDDVGSITYREMPIHDENGKALIHQTLYQDMWAWWTQAPIAERQLEKLGESDRGIIMYRQLIQEQLRIVEDGGDPMNTFRDPEQNRLIELRSEQNQYMAFLGNTNVEDAKTQAVFRADRVERSLSGFANTPVE
jgi:5,5'-dehydrodivanillate O-demethylase